MNTLSAPHPNPPFPPRLLAQKQSPSTGVFKTLNVYIVLYVYFRVINYSARILMGILDAGNYSKNTPHTSYYSRITPS